MRTELIIFDNDGVLVDSEPLIKIAQVKAFGLYGAEITPEWSYVNLHGLRASDVILAVEKHTGVKIPADKMLADFKEILSQLIDEKLEATLGIKDNLEKLAQAKKPVCVATSGPLLETYHKLEATKLAPFFEKNCIFSGEQVPNGKPAPDLMLLAANNMDFAPENCVVIEDAPFGIMAAKAAGMYAIGYMGGGHVQHTEGLSADTLYKAGADIVINHHNELLNVIP